MTKREIKLLKPIMKHSIEGLEHFGNGVNYLQLGKYEKALDEFSKSQVGMLTIMIRRLQKELDE